MSDFKSKTEKGFTLVFSISELTESEARIVKQKIEKLVKEMVN